MAVPPRQSLAQRGHLYQYNGTSFAPVRIIPYGGFARTRFGAAVALD
ncbi:MAG: hypothetical protein IPG64_08760 [Haliea sp.]|nr:hypothetical protein [Haliea sp.]